MYYPVKKYNYFKLVVLALAMLAWQSCEKFEYSPYEMRLSEDEKNINQRNIQKLETLHITRNTAFQFILIADSQGFYEENEQLVEHINRYHSDALFLLLGGDITDFGLLKEHKLIHHQLSKLKMP
ncbi:metallophosphoesterase family protein [Pontibacter fetidus]|uniref:Calcineurin-like phosphoesterase family protein n=1 Tax=Pontibacter fetidus TaxID=2700082 RepID=A0A6B2H3A3_9BACT|nr:hypothetical protein [Pontibacter fetidus]NDK56578.1 hypothetical protein [Pontibacter fetidus]